MELNVYVPAPDSPMRLSIDAGSAIVGSPHVSGRVLVDYEGNRFGAMKDWSEMLLHAADRHRTRYPTVARAYVPQSDLIPVGTYETDTDELIVDDEDALDRWRETASVPKS